MGLREVSRTRFLATAFVLAALTLLVACGGQGNSGTAGPDPAPPEQQVLRLRLPSEPKSMDPHLMNTSTETTLSKPLFAGLFTYDEGLNIVANLASEIPTDDNGGISKDGLTYTVKLDKDAKWSDGKAVTSQDVVYSMKRALDPKVASPYVSFFYSLSGAREYNTALGTPANRKNPSDAELAALRDKVGVSAKDERTVVYQLSEPEPSFLNLLALWTSFPVRSDVVEKYGNTWTEAGNHVSNGAFMLKEWARNERMVLVPNPYWNGEKPILQRIVINFIADDAAAYAAYLNDEIDMVTPPASVISELRNPAHELNGQLREAPELSTYAFIMNNTAAPFDNLKVRQAFAMAVDRNAYVDGVLQGAGKPTTSWIPPGMPGFNSALGKQYEFNPAKARQALAEAGYPEGRGMPKVTFLASDSATNRQLVGPFIEDQLKKNLGIEVSTNYVASATFGAMFTANEHQITIQRWNADWPYPDNFLPDLFGTGNLNNHAVYKNAKFDDVVRRAAAEVDEKKRLALYDEAHKIIMDDAAVAPLYNRQAFVLVKPKVKNLTLTALDGVIKGDYNLGKTYIAAGF